MAFDENLTLYTAGSAGVTDTATGDEKDFGSGDLHPITYQMDFPEAGSGADTLTATILGGNTSGSVTDVFASFRTITGSDIVAGQQEFVTAKTPYRYRKAVLTCSGSGSDFGVVTINPTLGGRYTNY